MLIKTFELTDQQMDITLSKVSKVACWYVVTPQLTKQLFSMVHLVQVTNFALIVDNCEQGRGLFTLNSLEKCNS